MFGSNFFNPYMAGTYSQAANLSGLGRMANTANMTNLATKGGLGKGLLSKFSFNGFLNGASKTLNVVNQAIPIFYQVKPMFNNAKTMFKIMGAVKDETPNKKNIDNSIITKSTVENSNVNAKINNSNNSDNNPTFFI